MIRSSRGRGGGRSASSCFAVPSAPHRRLVVGAVVVGLAFAALPSGAPVRAQTPSVARPDTTGFALILGGGGARGLAHVGVMRALEELGLRPSLVVGTSMGAILGSLYASGQDAARIQVLLAQRDWLDLLLDEREPAWRVQGGWHGLPRAQLRLNLDRWPPAPPAGVSFGQSVESLVGGLTADALVAANGDFDALPIPFRALCTDVVAARPVVFDHGALPRIVRASGSLPLVFVPVAYEGLTLMDGGLIDNLPVEVARDLGFTRSVIVDVSNVFLPQKGPPDDLFSMLRRTAELTQMGQNTVDPGPGEILLRLDLADHQSLGFWGADELVEKGYQAAMEQRARLEALAAERGAAAQGPPPVPVRLGPVELGEVSVVGARRMSGWAVRRRLGLRGRDRMELRELWRRAEQLGRQSAFEHVWIDPHPGADGRVDVVIHVVERDRPEVEFSANYRDGEGPALLTRLRLDNRLGAGSSRALTWRVGDESSFVILDMAQDLGRIRMAELRFRGGWQRERAEIFARDEEVDAWTFRRWRGGADLVLFRPGWPLALWTGVRAQSVHRALESRAPGSAADTEWRALHLGLETWTGGSMNPSPPRGLSVHYELGREVAGGDRRGWRLEGGWIGRRFLGRYFGIHGASGLALASEDLPVDLQARAGGPRGWVGLRRDEILSPRLLWQRVGFDLYMQREARLELAAAVGWWGRRSLDEHRPLLGLQLQLVLDTVVGPLHLGVAGRRHGESFAFVDVGYEF